MLCSRLIRRDGDVSVTYALQGNVIQISIRTTPGFNTSAYKEWDVTI